MSLTLEITADLERLLEAEASRTGSSPASVAHDMLRKSLSRRILPPDAAPRLSAEESELLEQINRGPSAAEMDRYLTLIRARQEESIGEAGLEELRAFTYRMEQLAVNRLTSLAALARLRGVDLEDLMDELQIQPPDVL